MKKSIQMHYASLDRSTWLNMILAFVVEDNVQGCVIKASPGIMTKRAITMSPRLGIRSFRHYSGCWEYVDPGQWHLTNDASTKVPVNANIDRRRIRDRLIFHFVFGNGPIEEQEACH